MGKAHGIVQTVKGEAQQVQGGIQQQTGHGIKGGLSKIKGKANEAIGKMRIENSNSRRKVVRE